MRKQVRMGLTALAGLMALSTAAFAALNAHEKKFLTEEIQGNKGEVVLGSLATKKASSPAVKEFGQRMVDDHTKATAQLEQIAKSNGITPPKQIKPDMKRAENRFSKLSGPAFDRAYMRYMVNDHTKDVKTFEKEIPKLKDPTLKETAEKMLPVLREHLAMARQTYNTVVGLKAKPAARGSRARTAPGK